MIVLNRHHHKGLWPPHHYYVGRPGRIAREETGRGAVDATILGNPFTLGDHGEDAVELYRRHLFDALRQPEVRELLLAMPPEAALVCSCSPRPCHGEVIATAWEWLFRRHRRMRQVVRLTEFTGGGLKHRSV